MRVNELEGPGTAGNSSDYECGDVSGTRCYGTIDIQRVIKPEEQKSTAKIEELRYTVDGGGFHNMIDPTAVFWPHSWRMC
jgi:hypothetical protein